MSVYIKGMEMPKYCGECRFCLDDSRIANGYCMYFHSRANLYELRKDCPLIPVPDHGRLVDKDTVCAECRRVAAEYDGIYPDCTYCPLHIAPTIIPASKEAGE